MEEAAMGRFAQRMTELKYYVLHPSERITGDLEPLIRRLETEIGAPLPDDYRGFLAEFGGATFPELFEAPITEPGHPGEYACPWVFFGFYNPDARGIPHSHDLRSNYSEYKSRVRFGLIPIAEAIGGNLICLSVSGSNRGSVYYWDHETNDVWLVSNSFDEFLSSLQLTEDEEDE
jgi:hypothetical protein